MNSIRRNIIKDIYETIHVLDIEDNHDGGDESRQQIPADKGDSAHPEGVSRPGHGVDDHAAGLVLPGDEATGEKTWTIITSLSCGAIRL